MKFLCVGCDAQMISVDRAAPEDGTLAIVFACPECGREVAMLANAMETQMVKSLCVEVGGRTTPERPLEGVRAHLEARSSSGDNTEMVQSGTPGEEVAGSGRVGDDRPGDTTATPGARPSWSPEAEARLGRIPGFVRGMVRQLYVDWALEHGVTEISLEVMDRARADVGLESMGETDRIPGF